MALHEAEIKQLKSICNESRQESAQIMNKGNYLFPSWLEITILIICELKEVQWETTRVTLETKITQTQIELEMYRNKATELERFLEEERRDRRIERDDSQRRLRDETNNLRRQHQQFLDSLERKLRLELMDEKAARTREVQEMKNNAALDKQRLEMQMDGTGRETRNLKMELEAKIAELEKERNLNNSLRDKIAEQDSTCLGIESATRTLKARVAALENQGLIQMQQHATVQRKLQETIQRNAKVEEKLRNEEIIRRRLHNQVQELKGNIRVFCRVRPTLRDESEIVAEIRFPDIDMEAKAIEVIGSPDKNALGKELTKTYPFSFDKVFGPTHRNIDVFQEISQLVQSALDGYNVCIFCYGQTGSGKTYTMSASDGMIPRAVHQIFESAKGLEEKGWTYTMEGSFVEVYNENINDLLGKADDIDRKKHEIRHDPKECKTTITGVETAILDTPTRVDLLLRRASQTRSVAATKANERSSRSHSVFILKLVGVNLITGQRSEGTLNLVDLAGSERLSHSQSTGERLKETQSINRSLSCLGDVIAALGSGKEGSHIPYRNSKVSSCFIQNYSTGSHFGGWYTMTD